MKVCPACNSKTGVRDIFYGYPAKWPVDEDSYTIGGCCVSDNDPTKKCIECGWKGAYVNNMGGDNGFLKAIKLPDVSDMSDEEIQIHAKQIWQKLAKPKKESDDGNSKS